MSFPRLLPAVAAAALAAASPALAQLAYTEPPDLGNTFAAATPLSPPVGAGLNTVDGRMVANWLPSGEALGDPGDAFFFRVPAGFRATAIDVAVTNRVSANAVETATIQGRGSASITGNGTFPISLGGNGFLPAGDYGLGMFAGLNIPGAPSTASMNYSFRITAIRTNDACANAWSVGLGATEFNNSDATTDGPDHRECSYLGTLGVSHDLWYTYTASADAALTVNTCGSSFDTILAVYGGGPGSPVGIALCADLLGSILACNDNTSMCSGGAVATVQSRVRIAVAAGQTYLIRVGGYSVATGPGVLNLALDSLGACCNRRTGGCLVLSPADCATIGCHFGGFATTCSPATCTACPADFNNSGAASVQDIFDFLAAYFAGCP